MCYAMHHGPLSLVPAAMMMTSIMAAASTMPWLPSSSTSNNANLELRPGPSSFAGTRHRTRERERRSRRPGWIGRPLVEAWSPLCDAWRSMCSSEAATDGRRWGDLLYCVLHVVVYGGGHEPGSGPKDQAQENPAMPLVQSPFILFSFISWPNNDLLPKVYMKTPPRIWETESSYMSVFRIHPT